MCGVLRFSVWEVSQVVCWLLSWKKSPVPMSIKMCGVLVFYVQEGFSRCVLLTELRVIDCANELQDVRLWKIPLRTIDSLKTQRHRDTNSESSSMQIAFDVENSSNRSRQRVCARESADVISSA